MTDGLVFTLIAAGYFLVPLAVGAIIIEGYLSAQSWLARRRSILRRRRALRYRPMATLPPSNRPEPVTVRITRTRNTTTPNDQENQS